MTRLVLWSLSSNGWERVAAVPVSAERAADALDNAQSWIPARMRGLMRFELEPQPEPAPVLAAVA